MQLLTLARLGIGKFSIADFDVFDIVNFNRQVGATVQSLERPKIEVLSEMALDINPALELRTFPKGINEDCLDEFLDGVDVYVDGLDFFAFSARRMTFAACERKGIPVVTAAPLGLGTALLVFGPGGMPFEDYFGFEGCDEMEMAIRFLVGLSPAMLQRGYVVDMSRINLAERRGPSCIASCQLCAGVAAVEVLKLALNRQGVKLAPWGSQFDAFGGLGCMDVLAGCCWQTLAMLFNWSPNTDAWAVFVLQANQLLDKLFFQLAFGGSQ